MRAGELGDRAGDLLEQGLEVELLRERPIDVREGADSVLACGGGGLGSPTLVHRLVELRGQLGQLVGRRHGDRRAGARGELARAVDQRAHRSGHATADEPCGPQRGEGHGPEADQVPSESSGSRRIGQIARRRPERHPRCSRHRRRGGEPGHAVVPSPLRDTRALANQRPGAFGNLQRPAERRGRGTGARHQHARAGHDGRGCGVHQRHTVEIGGKCGQIDLGGHCAERNPTASENRHHDRHHQAAVRRARLGRADVSPAIAEPCPESIARAKRRRRIRHRAGHWRR